MREGVVVGFGEELDFEESRVYEVRRKDAGVWLFIVLVGIRLVRKEEWGLCMGSGVVFTATNIVKGSDGDHRSLGAFFIIRPNSVQNRRL